MNGDQPSMIEEDSEIKSAVCDFGNLYRAMRKCKRGVSWKDSVAGFAKNGLVNCYKLKESLYDGTYHLNPYTMFKVYEPKERDIVSTRFKDRVFQRSLCDNYLTKQVSNSFIRDNTACRENMGTDDARRRLKVHLLRFYRKFGTAGNVRKFDIHDYFGSTSHQKSMDALDKRVYDDWALDQVRVIINSFNQGVNPFVGNGLGSQVTQITQLAVLDDMDHFIKEQLHIKYYVRYMDDFILLHESKEYLDYCEEKIAQHLSERGLTLNTKKTVGFPITHHIRFLGYTFRLTDTGKVVVKMLPEKISKERRKLRKLVERAKAGLMTREEVNESYEGWKAHAAFGNTHKLILEMDQYYKNLWR